MPPARPLRDVFADLSGTADGSGVDGRSPEALLAEAGHPQLPAGLVAEAVVSYADTAPIEVAEHLAPYVMAHSAVPTDVVDDVDQPRWFELLSAAPDPAGIEPLPAVDHPGPEAVDPTAHVWFGAGATDAAVDLDFGHGAAGTDVASGHEHGTHPGHLAALGDGPGGDPDGHGYHGDVQVVDAAMPLDNPGSDEGHPHHHAYLDDDRVDDGHLHDGHGATDGPDHHDLPGDHDGW
jgi:hypothetical protein